MPKSGVTVTFKDLGMGSIFQRMRELNALSLSVGVQGEKGRALFDLSHRSRDPESGKFKTTVETSTVTLAQVAFWNEFGTNAGPKHPGIPARSFLRGALFQYQAQIEKAIAETLAKFLATKSMQATTALATIGKFVAGRVKVRIMTPGLWAKPNAAATIADKGFNRPLHGNTTGPGKLSNSITWAVRAGAGGPILLEGPAR